MRGMQPNLLMRAWMMAHLYGAEFQAVVCSGGSSGEVAFRESLCPQYTSDRHDAKGLRTYHITGTHGGLAVSRIASGRIGNAANEITVITVTSNACAWQKGDLVGCVHLVSLDLDMDRLTEIPAWFLSGCSNLERVSLTALHAIRTIPRGFLSGCRRLLEVDLSPLVKVVDVGSCFLGDLTFWEV